MKLAIVQDGPIYLNAEATLQKTIDYIRSAAKENSDLIVFGETWFSGYPVWLDICQDINLWDFAPVKSVWKQTFEQGLPKISGAMTELQKVIRESQINVVLGANEPILKGLGNGSLFNSVFTFGRDGSIQNHHRKLMPTFTEKLVHSIGDGAGLRSVSTDFGQLGSLICWEHWMPHARQSMHDAGEDIHIALWPYAKELHHLASRHYAHEGRCYVVAVGQVMHESELPNQLIISNQSKIPESGLILRGGSAVYAPDGSILLSPKYDTRELIYVEIDLELNLGERMNLSVSGHYQRHDIFSLQINRERKF